MWMPRRCRESRTCREKNICPPIMSSWQIGTPSAPVSQRSSRRRWWRMEACSRRTFCAAGMKRLPASKASGCMRWTVNCPVSAIRLEG
ncbi:hypothetical protein SALBM135S_08724 [Streptomyces alboniger]